MKNIFILGAGGFAKEVYTLIRHIGGYEVKGFIDKEAGADITIGNNTIRVFPENILETVQESFELAIGIGNPALIARIAERLNNHSYPNLIHPSAIGNFEDVIFGRGNIITANCVFTTAIRVGDFNVFNLSCTIGHDVQIGNHNVLNPAVNISGGVEIGDANLIGVNATILQYKKIGNNSIVGASSLVTKDVPDNVTVIGIPAVKISNR